MSDWRYVGDINPANGGEWFDVSTFDEGYVEAVMATKAMGPSIPGSVMVYKTTVNTEGEENNPHLSDITGMSLDELKSLDAAELAKELAHAAVCDGREDEPEHVLLVQMDPNGPTDDVDLHDPNFDITAYVQETFMAPDAPSPC